MTSEEQKEIMKVQSGKIEKKKIENKKLVSERKQCRKHC